MDPRNLLMLLVGVAGASTSIALTRLVHARLDRAGHGRAGHDASRRYMLQAVGALAISLPTLALTAAVGQRAGALTAADGYTLPLVAVAVASGLTVQGILLVAPRERRASAAWPLAGPRALWVFVASTIALAIVVPVFAVLGVPGLLFEPADVPWVLGGTALLVVGVILNLRRIALHLPLPGADVAFRRVAGDFSLWMACIVVLLLLCSAFTWTAVAAWEATPFGPRGVGALAAVSLGVASVTTVALDLAAIGAAVSTAVTLGREVRRLAGASAGTVRARGASVSG